MSSASLKEARNAIKQLREKKNAPLQEQMSFFRSVGEYLKRAYAVVDIATIAEAGEILDTFYNAFDDQSEELYGTEVKEKLRRMRSRSASIIRSIQVTKTFGDTSSLDNVTVLGEEMLEMAHDLEFF